jgi:3-methyladenine DNA glycosylase AlkD
MPDKKLSPPAIARMAREALKAKADPARARGAERYFKETVKCYGVAAADIHALAAELHGLVKADWSVDDAVGLCDILYADAELEAKAIASLVLRRFHKDLPPSLFSKVKGWLGDDLLANWASVDTLCPDVMGAFLLKYPAYVDRIKAWAGHPNRWVKRAALVSFIKLARRAEILPGSRQGRSGPPGAVPSGRRPGHPADDIALCHRALPGRQEGSAP